MNFKLWTFILLYLSSQSSYEEKVISCAGKLSKPSPDNENVDKSRLLYSKLLPVTRGVARIHVLWVLNTEKLIDGKTSISVSGVCEQH